MSGIKAKFHDADASIRKKYAEQQTGGHGLGVKDRFRVARGENVRWEQTRTSARPNTELGEDYGAGGAGVAHRLPPLPPGMPPPHASSPSSPAPAARASRAPPPPARGGAAAPRGGAPPPPPARSRPGTLGASAGTPPPPPARGGTAAPAPPVPAGAKPRLPLRMNNEAGIDNPPPPYGAATTGAGASAPSGAGHVAFSRFTQADKAQFFALLDEYFASKGADVTPAY